MRQEAPAVLNLQLAAGAHIEIARHEPSTVDIDNALIVNCHAGERGKTLAILNGDWDGNRNGAGPLYTWTNEEDVMVITYHNWCPRHDQQIGGCFQIILTDDGMIK